MWLDAPESYSSVKGFACPCPTHTGDRPAAVAAALAALGPDVSAGAGISSIATHASISSFSSLAGAASSFAALPHCGPCPSLPFLAATFRPALRLVMASLVAIVAFDLALVFALVLAFAIARVHSQGFILRFGVVVLNLAVLRFVNHKLLKYLCCEDLASKACV